MKLGLVMDPRLDRDWEAALDLVVLNGITHVEPCGGGHVPTSYVDPVRFAADSAELDRFHRSITDRGLTISALGCYGNPVHPDDDRARAARTDIAAMCEVAGALGVDRINVISGVPAGGPGDRAPNWIIPSIYADLENAYRWQWEEKLIPYWREACDIADQHGVRLCMEPLGGFMVYNAQTFLRLREACDERLMVNLDPSHVFWMGIDPIRYVEQLAGSIGHVHAKDVAINAERVALHGVVPACRYDEWRERSWSPTAVGFGHDESFWKRFFTALRQAGYDDVVAIEIEEAFMSTDEAVARSVEMLARTMPRDPIPTSNWFDKYEWSSAPVE